jgi:hypothetical protein
MTPQQQTAVHKFRGAAAKERLFDDELFLVFLAS